MHQGRTLEQTLVADELFQRVYYIHGTRFAQKNGIDYIFIPIHKQHDDWSRSAIVAVRRNRRRQCIFLRKSEAGVAIGLNLQPGSPSRCIITDKIIIA